MSPIQQITVHTCFRIRVQIPELGSRFWSVVQGSRVPILDEIGEKYSAFSVGTNSIYPGSTYLLSKHIDNFLLLRFLPYIYS